MSESTGPQNFSNKDVFDYKDLASLREVGSNIPGTQIKIMKENPREQDGNYDVIQEKYAIEGETFLWDTLRIQNNQTKSLTRMVTCIQGIWAK